jgi:hypothetical protein
VSAATDRKGGTALRVVAAASASACLVRNLVIGDGLCRPDLFGYIAAKWPGGGSVPLRY